MHGLKGYKQTPEHKARVIAARAGYKTSEETKAKQRARKLGKKHTLEHNKKISLGNTGKKMSDTFRKYISLRQTGKGNTNYKHGKANTLEMTNHYSRMRNYREKNADGSFTLKEWETLQAQYNWTCPCCNKRDKLTVDHIIPLSK
jgi:hypothetical protein